MILILVTFVAQRKQNKLQAESVELLTCPLSLLSSESHEKMESYKKNFE